MPRHRRLSRGQTRLRKKYKSHEKEKTIPLKRKSASLISVKSSIESKLHLTKSFNKGDETVPLKSCLSSHKHNEKIKMQVKFYLKTGDGPFHNATHRSPYVIKNQRKVKESVTTQQQSAISPNNKIGFHGRGTTGNNASKQIGIKSKEHDEKM